MWLCTCWSLLYRRKNAEQSCFHNALWISFPSPPTPNLLALAFHIPFLVIDIMEPRELVSWKLFFFREASFSLSHFLYFVFLDVIKQLVSLGVPQSYILGLLIQSTFTTQILKSSHCCQQSGFPQLCNFRIDRISFVVWRLRLVLRVKRRSLTANLGTILSLLKGDGFVNKHQKTK